MVQLYKALTVAYSMPNGKVKCFWGNILGNSNFSNALIT